MNTTTDSTTTTTTTTMNTTSLAAALYRKFCKQLNSDYQKTMHLPEPDMFALNCEVAFQFKQARSRKGESERVRRDDPRLATYWQRYDEDMAKTEEEWDALIAQSAKASHEAREKVLAKIAAKKR